jgi:hypothetical protein
MNTLAMLFAVMSIDAGVQQTWTGGPGGNGSELWQTKAVAIAKLPLTPTLNLVSEAAYGLEDKDHYYTIGLCFKIK